MTEQRRIQQTSTRPSRLTGLSTMTAIKRIAVGTQNSCRHSQLSRAILSSSNTSKELRAKVGDDLKLAYRGWRQAKPDLSQEGCAFERRCDHRISNARGIER